MIGEQQVADPVERALDGHASEGVIALPDVMSRKQQVAPKLRVVLFSQQPVCKQHLGEHRRGFSQRQGGVEGHYRVISSEHSVNGMTELVRKGGYFAGFAGVVCQYPGS